MVNEAIDVMMFLVTDLVMGLSHYSNIIRMKCNLSCGHIAISVAVN